MTVVSSVTSGASTVSVGGVSSSGYVFVTGESNINKVGVVATSATGSSAPHTGARSRCCR